MNRRPMNWAEKQLADYADAIAEDEEYWRGRRQVDASRWWWAEERFTQSMALLTYRIENGLTESENPLDTRDRIREYGPSSGGQRVRRIAWEEPRQ